MNEEELQWLKEISTTTGISYSGDMTITTDFANKLIDYIKELEQLQINWNELKKFVKERIKFIQEEKAEFEEDLYNDYETNKEEITIRRCNLTQLEDVQERMQELEKGKDE